MLATETQEIADFLKNTMLKKYGADKEEAYSKADIFALPNQLPLTNASHW